MASGSCLNLPVVSADERHTCPESFSKFLGRCDVDCVQRSDRMRPSSIGGFSLHLSSTRTSCIWYTRTDWRFSLSIKTILLIRTRNVSVDLQVINQADYARAPRHAVIAGGACWQRSRVQQIWRSIRRFPCNHSSGPIARNRDKSDLRKVAAHLRERLFVSLRDHGVNAGGAAGGIGQLFLHRPQICDGKFSVTLSVADECSAPPLG